MLTSGLQVIGINMFNGNGLSVLTIPSSVTIIGIKNNNTNKNTILKDLEHLLLTQS